MPFSRMSPIGRGADVARRDAGVEGNTSHISTISTVVPVSLS